MKKIQTVIMISDNSPSSTKILEEDQEFYPNIETRKYLQRQSELYKQNKPQLLDKYAGMYIIFEDGKVIDADEDETALVMRTYETMGVRDLFVKKVITDEPNLVARVPFPLQ